jgi:hypothetical protein
MHTQKNNLPSPTRVKLKSRHEMRCVCDSLADSPTAKAKQRETSLLFQCVIIILLDLGFAKELLDYFIR